VIFVTGNIAICYFRVSRTLGIIHKLSTLNKLGILQCDVPKLVLTFEESTLP
jgi:hypothetical protein